MICVFFVSVHQIFIRISNEFVYILKTLNKLLKN